MSIRPHLATAAALLMGCAIAAPCGQDPAWQVLLPQGPHGARPLGATRVDGLRTLILLGSQGGPLELATLGPGGSLDALVPGPSLASGTSPVCAVQGAMGQWHVAVGATDGAPGPPGSGSPLGGDDILMVRIGTGGASLSVERLGTSRDDRPRALVSAPDGGAFMAGTTVRSGVSFGSTGPRTVGYVARIDAAGQRVWSRIVPGLGQPGSNLHVTPHGLTLDLVLGQVHVGGEARSSPGAPRQSALFTLGMDGDFVSAQFGDIPQGAITALAVDDAGTLYLGGENDVTRGAELIGRGSAGTWRRPLASPAGPWGRCRVAGLTPSGAGVVAYSASTGHSDPQLGSSVRMDHASDGGEVVPLMVGTAQVGVSTTAGFMTEVMDGALVGLGARDGVPTAFLVMGPPRFQPGCPSGPHAGGTTAHLAAAGAGRVDDPALMLQVADAPPRTFGIFICSPLPGLVPGAGGGTGTLCLGGSIGRFDAPAEIWQSSEGGCAHRVVSLAALPTPGSPRAAVVGESWHFQAWFRDGGSTGFSSSLAVDIR